MCPVVEHFEKVAFSVAGPRAYNDFPADLRITSDTPILSTISLGLIRLL